MTRDLFALAVAVVVMAGVAPAQAAVPRLINFQGRLADGSGTPLTGSHQMTFKIYNALTGGTACFTETQAVAVNSGLFNANIGGNTSGGIASACDFSVPYYLELTVAPDAAMSPRAALTSAAYALRAQIADDSVKLNGLTQGNGAGQVPSNNGVVQTSFNADLLDGLDWSSVNKVAYTPNNNCSGANSTLYLSSTCSVTYNASDSCPANTNNTGWTVYSNCNYAAAAPSCPAGCTQTSYTCVVQTTCPEYDAPNSNAYGWRRVCSCPNTIYGYLKQP